jgi:hypothetical protein
MEAQDWQNFVAELYPAASKDPGVIEIAKTLPDKYQIQYEFRGLPDCDFWQEWTHDEGILIHAGKAPKPGYRISSPSLDIFEQFISGKADAAAAAAYGVLTFGPLPILMKVSPVLPFVAKVYPEIRAKYPK